MKSKKVGKVKEVVVEAPPVVEAPEPSVEPVPPSPSPVDEVVGLVVKIAIGASTLGDEERLWTIGRAIAAGLPVPPKVVGTPADHRSGRGRIPQRNS